MARKKERMAPYVEIVKESPFMDKLKPASDIMTEVFMEN
jgi:hypothetical protein